MWGEPSVIIGNIWVPSEVMKEAKALSVAEAESILSPWLALIRRA